ncbi:CDP-alcohol phosphatidyltransferase family protein [Georgenia sp. 311]|uniref:CDP-alcohol phosphatidyltransferase family protein n=1 Tax=Georgenia wutianyii TaxID=2585135 RepID=A0ABX5VRA3_9MICO|nr:MULTISPECIES: CDP-alcohol phosphatidyltransferase family protein [Georgenia]QDB80171.1 CDP-alcohol phosphatidyltransferase family protein [Georgenia wutianyii]TNC20145.1 CDP-alcohol phosphatidyltransferase family protein [Georgenia sp. 311]
MVEATASSFTESVRALRSAQKSAKGAPLYSRFVNRPAGRLLAALAHQAGLSPNQVTAVSAAFTFTGVALIALAPPSPAMAAGVALLLVVGYALDSADGQLARLLGAGSVAGDWLDHVCDCLKTTTIHLAVLVSLFRFADVPQEWLLLPLLYAPVDTLLFFAFVLTQSRRRPGDPAPTAGPASLARSVLSLPTDYGVLCLVLLTLAWPPAFLLLYGAMFLGTAGYTALALPTWFRRLSRQES